MAEYIDRASLINNLITFAPEHYTSLLNDLILKEPDADVVERKKGKWIADEWDADDDRECICSRCREQGLAKPGRYDVYLSNFCPNCGADMREES